MVLSFVDVVVVVEDDVTYSCEEVADEELPQVAFVPRQGCGAVRWVGGWVEREVSKGLWEVSSCLSARGLYSRKERGVFVFPWWVEAPPHPINALTTEEGAVPLASGGAAGLPEP